MDIMRPKITVIGNCFFRRFDEPNHSSNSSVDNQLTATHVSDGHNEPNDDYNDEPIDCEKAVSKDFDLESTKECVDNDTEEDTQIEKIFTNGVDRYQTSLSVAKEFRGIIIGARGLTKKSIESDTNTTIYVPKETDFRSPISITGDTFGDVKRAKSKIEAIVESKRSTVELSHFVSIPFNENPIHDSFLEFKRQVLAHNDCSQSRGVDELLFQLPNKLHVTLVPLFLGDQNERQRATQILNTFSEQFVKSVTNGPIRVRIEGLEYMNDDPCEVNVLYAKVVDLSPNKCLQSMANEIFSRFEKSKFVTRQQNYQRVDDKVSVKLHLTVMNSSFKKESTSSGREHNWRTSHITRDNPRRDSSNYKFDASAILKHFANYSFGETTVNEIHISIRHSYRGKNGYYSHTSMIAL